jgi:hypothetical protein
MTPAWFLCEVVRRQFKAHAFWMDLEKRKKKEKEGTEKDDRVYCVVIFELFLFPRGVYS